MDSKYKYFNNNELNVIRTKREGTIKRQQQKNATLRSTYYWKTIASTNNQVQQQQLKHGSLQGV